MSPPRRSAVAFVFVTIVLDVLALGVTIPVLPKLVEAFAGGDPANGARVFGLFATVWALMQFVFSPVLGALSDRLGRRPVILVSCFGLGLDYVLMALAPDLSWLFVGRVLSGILAASQATAMAYLADVTPPEDRAANFGLVGAAWGLGFVLGPALGGVLGGVGPRLPFWVAAGLTLAGALWGLAVLPESLPRDRRARFEWTRANPFGSLVLLRSHPGLLGLAGVYFLYFAAHHVLPSVWVLYSSHRHGWSETTIGLTLAAVGVSNVLVQGALVRPIVARFGERRTLLAGLLFGAAGFATYGLAPSGTIFFAAVPVFALIGLFGPAAQAIMSRRVPPTEQGRLQGATSSLMGIAGVVGPIVFTAAFARFIDSLPGAPFLLAALLQVAAWALAWRVTRTVAAVAAPGEPATARASLE